MAIDAIRKDLLRTIKSGDTMTQLREFQFKSQCVCISHDPKRIAITGWNALVTMASGTKNKRLLNFINTEEKIVKNIILFEAERVFGDPANVTKMHIKHGYTIHSIQGKTTKNKLFIDMDKLDTHKRILYTALSRVRRISQIYLIYE